MTSTRKRGAPRENAPLARRRGRDRSRRDVYVVVEGCATEIDYLRHLEDEYGRSHGFHINAKANAAGGYTPSQALAEARQISSDLANEWPEARHSPSGTRVWILFDRDENEPRELQNVIVESERHGIGVGFSHPCFELWLYLHLHDSPGPQGGERQKLYQALRQADPAFKKYGSRDSGKHLTSRQAKTLRGREYDAARRARRLVVGCDDGTCDHPVKGRCTAVCRDPSTTVYRLLEELGLIRPII
jgi:hypothetical protein